MAGEWRDYKVGDLFDLKPGFAFKSADFIESGAPVIKIKNVKAGSVVLDDLSYVDERFLDTKRSYIVNNGDILITMSGNRFDGSRETWVGKVAQFMSDEPYLLNQRVAILKPKAGAQLDRRCCSYILGSSEYQDLFIAIATSSGGQANLSPGQILGADILLPPYDEQRAIAHILGTLDDKIELNRRINETLEAMARALFKSWFVDFDPVRAKAEGKDPGLPKPLADLFPDSFEDSELGEIPKEWEVGTISDFATLNPEVWSKDTRPSVINYVDLSNTKWGRIEEIMTYTQKEAPSRAQRVLRPQDTIVGTVRPGNGSYALISQNGLTGSTGFAVLRPLRSECAEFVYLVATAADNIDRLSHLADGAAYPAVRPEVVAATQAMKAPDKIIETFSRIVWPLIIRMTANESESRALATVRDSLLPKLISGELRVNNEAGRMEMQA